jgi:DNA polymerase (family 10)
MPIHNAEIARNLEEIADLLAVQGANRFRIRAYRTAAQSINTLPHDVASMVTEGADLTDLPGIGKDIAGKIQELVETGSLAQLEELRQDTSPDLANLLNVSGLGAKRVRTLHETLGISSLKELQQAAREGRVREVPGFGAKTERSLLEAIERQQNQNGGEQRYKLSEADQLVSPLLDFLRAGSNIEALDVAGSYRRRQETIGDLDLLVISDAGGEVLSRFVQYENVGKVISQGDTRATVVLRSGLQVDLRVVAPESYGAALLYFTGSKAHNIALRNRALARDLKISEYGVFRGDEHIAGTTEAEVYATLDLPYVVPELRENRGEIDAATQGDLPDLVCLEDMRGNLHTHSTASDGKASLEQLAQAARERGLEYLAITDHSQRLTVANGLTPERLERQIEEIDALNEKLDGVTLLKGIEVDILEDGTLDLPDELLAQLDIVVCSIHSKLNLSSEQQTERVLRAIEHPACTILAHPTGRLINRRPPYTLDMERVLHAMAEAGCYIELNAQPDRLDVNDIHARMARERGVKVAISTDAHRVAELDYLRFGVDQARRGWLAAADVLNTRSLADLRTLLRR